jgi:hypothetical protein
MDVVCSLGLDLVCSMENGGFMEVCKEQASRVVHCLIFCEYFSYSRNPLHLYFLKKGQNQTNQNKGDKED